MRLIPPVARLAALGLVASLAAAAEAQTIQSLFGGLDAQAALMLPPTPRDAVRARVLFLPEHAEALAASPDGDGETLLMTGAYSSGDRFAPEGFVIRQGDATHPWPQGWDGLLLIDGDGRPSLHFVEEVRHAGLSWNLRDQGGRGAFTRRAERDGLTAIQSHLLIRDGRLDLRRVAGAPSFRRRLLFETADGEIGVFDTSPTPMTLYDAANALRDAVDPRFALNLDMGNYDFCEHRVGDRTRRCGVLQRGALDKLTNVIELRIAPF